VRRIKVSFILIIWYIVNCVHRFKSTESIEEDWISFLLLFKFFGIRLRLCMFFDFVGLAETEGWVVLVTLDGIDSDECLEDASVCDNQDVEGFCVLDLVVRVVVMGSKWEGRISAPASVCTALDTVFCGYRSVCNLSFWFDMSACLSEGQIVSVFKVCDFLFLVKSRTFFGERRMVFLTINTYCRVFCVHVVYCNASSCTLGLTIQ